MMNQSLLQQQGSTPVDLDRISEGHQPLDIANALLGKMGRLGKPQQQVPDMTQMAPPMVRTVPQLDRPNEPANPY
jgi:hypothetical protein